CEAAANGQVCAPANFNSPEQTVIAGHKEAVERAVEECKARGAKRAMMLKVSAPFHSALMTPAREKMIEPLTGAAFNDLSFPIVNNVDAAIVTGGFQSRDPLIRPIFPPLRRTRSGMKKFAQSA